MRKVFILLVCMMISVAAWAQPAGYKAMKDVNAFRETLAKSNAAKQTISSDFTQTKNMALLEEKIKSKGKFYFKKDDKVRIEYTSPYSYLLVMNGGQIMVKDEQKTSRINTRGSQTMQSVNRIMVDCMQGSVFTNSDFKVSAYENGTTYLLSLQPVTPTMKKMFRSIDVYMDKKGLDVDRLTMTETGGDYTDMDFSNTKHNVALNEALFKVK